MDVSVSPGLDSDYNSLAEMPREGCCIFLSSSRQEAHGVDPSFTEDAIGDFYSPHFPHQRPYSWVNLAGKLLTWGLPNGDFSSSIISFTFLGVFLL